MLDTVSKENQEFKNIYLTKYRSFRVKLLDDDTIMINELDAGVYRLLKNKGPYHHTLQAQEYIEGLGINIALTLFLDDEHTLLSNVRHIKFH